MDEILKLDFLNGLQATGINPSLDNISAFMPVVGSPEKKIRCVLVGGTNGKGSTCAFIERILRAEGLKTGLFTSPHLVDVRERIRINGKMIGLDQLKRKGEFVRESMEHSGIRLTFFEAITVVALTYFQEIGIDFAIFEVGLGGRFDATNILNPLISVITNISMDHTEMLGNTLEKIAFEKAGIIKNEKYLVSGVEKELSFKVIEPICIERNTAFRRSGFHFFSDWKDGYFSYKSDKLSIQNIRLSLSGFYQKYNASLAVASVETLNNHYGFQISDNSIKEGLMNTSWHGRFQIISESPLILMDGAHNPDGASKLKESIKEFLSKREKFKLTIIFGAKPNKNIEKIMETLIDIADKIILTSAEGLINTKDLKSRLSCFSVDCIEMPDAVTAVKTAIKSSSPQDIILITGSLYLLGHIIKKMFPNLLDNNFK